MKSFRVVLLLSVFLLVPRAARAVTVAASYRGTVFGVSGKYEYAPALMRNSRSNPSVVRCWFGGEEWGSFVRVRAGGPPFTDPEGRVWTDTGFSGGTTYGAAIPIAGTSTPELYQTHRSGSFQYTFSGLPAGTYQITLKFAEIRFTHPGERVFDVLVNSGAAGRRDGFDVVAEAGGPARAVDLEFRAYDATSVTVSFEPRVGDPMISAIEISVPFLDTVKYTETAAFPEPWAGSSVVLCPSTGGADLFEDPGYPRCTGDNPLGADRDLVNDPSVVFVDGQYWMYYTAPQVGAPTFGTCNQVFLARSSDGRSFTKYPDASHPAQPVVPYSGVCDGTTFFEYGIGEASVVYKDGLFWMYYYRSPDALHRAEMLATSADGVNFTPGVSVVSTFGLNGGDVKWIPGWNLWLLVGARTTYREDFPDPATKGLMFWNISRDGVHWLPDSFHLADRGFHTGQYQNLTPGLLGNELGWIGDGSVTGTKTVSVLYGAGTTDPRTWDLDAIDLTLATEPLSGSLDDITPDLVARGWAYDPDAGTNDAAGDGSPPGPLGLGTRVRAVAVHAVTGEKRKSPWLAAELPRCDLVRAGVAPDCFHGFRIELKDLLTPGAWRVHVEGREFPGGEKTVIGPDRAVKVKREGPQPPGDAAPLR